MLKITSYQVIKKVAKKTKQSQNICEEIIDVFFEEIKKELCKGGKVIINNFAVFETVEKGERLGRNPKTGVVEKFPPSKLVKCRLSKKLKNEVKKGKKK